MQLPLHCADERNLLDIENAADFLFLLFLFD